MDSHHDHHSAAIVLAGGDGVRLSSMTREIFGYALPKQFLPLFKGETLLEQTLCRVSLVVPRARTITVLNRAHERFYSPLLTGVEPRNLLIQPANRGTAPAIMSPLMRLTEAGHTGAVAIFPSDHYVSDDSEFMRQVAMAFAEVEFSPRLIVLLGIAPDGPKSGYGWIEPGAPVTPADCIFGRIAPICRFWEKPSPEVASRLFGCGCLWNSFILVANVERLQSLVAKALPELYTAFTRVRHSLGTAREKGALETVYSGLPSLNFSERVLSEFPSELSVLPITGVEWSDLGEPARLLAVMSSKGIRPEWLDRLQVSAQLEGR